LDFGWGLALAEMSRFKTQMTDPARVIEAMPDGLYVVDRTRTITFWNGAAARITGYSEENAVGRR